MLNNDNSLLARGLLESKLHNLSLSSPTENAYSSLLNGLGNGLSCSAKDYIKPLSQIDKFTTGLIDTMQEQNNRFESLSKSLFNSYNTAKNIPLSLATTCSTFTNLFTQDNQNSIFDDFLSFMQPNTNNVSPFFGNNIVNSTDVVIKKYKPMPELQKSNSESYEEIASSILHELGYDIKNSTNTITLLRVQGVKNCFVNIVSNNNYRDDAVALMKILIKFGDEQSNTTIKYKASNATKNRNKQEKEFLINEYNKIKAFANFGGYVWRGGFNKSKFCEDVKKKLNDKLKKTITSKTIVNWLNDYLNN